MALSTLLRGIASRVLPQAQPDGQEQNVRLSRYGDLRAESLYPDFSALVDEGAYYVAQASAIAGHILAAFDATKPFLLLQNADSAPAATSGKRIYLDYIKYQVTTAPASGTNANFQINLDTANRWSSAGTLLTPVNVNSGASGQSIAQPRVALPIATAASNNVRLLDLGVTRTVIPIASDIMIFNFGSVEKSPPAVLISNAGPGVFIYNVPPAVIEVGHSFLFYLFFASNSATAQSANWTIGWWER